MGIYQIINKENRKAFLELFTGKRKEYEGFSLGNLESHRSSTLQEACSRWPQIELFSLETPKEIQLPRWYPYRTPAGRIRTEAGEFIIMRNGSNVSHYNMVAINLTLKKFYFRQNKRALLNLIEILTSKQEDLPLMISRNMCEKNKTLMEKRLKE